MSHNLCKEEFALSSEPWVETIELSFYEEGDIAMSHHVSKQHPLGEGEKMICHQCFTAKQLDSKTRRVCQNKKCLFFDKARPQQTNPPSFPKHFETIPNGDKFELQRTDSQGSLSDEVAAFTGNLSLSGGRWPAFYGGAGGSLWDTAGVVGVMPSKCEQLDTDFDRKRFYSATAAPATSTLAHTVTTASRGWRSEHVRHGSLSLPFSNNQSENEEEEDDTFLPQYIPGGQLQEVCMSVLCNDL